jgi:hypothetical protein
MVTSDATLLASPTQGRDDAILVSFVLLILGPPLKKLRRARPSQYQANSR